jgi:hypothetical protein
LPPKLGNASAELVNSGSATFSRKVRLPLVVFVVVCEVFVIGIASSTVEES